MENEQNWRKLPGETGKAYESFCIYRDLGPKRSITKVQTEMHQNSTKNQPTSRPSIRTLKEWSSKNKWVERATAYDSYIDDLRRLGHEQEIMEMSTRHVKIARNFQDKVDKRLNSLNPDDLSPQDLVRWCDTAVKIERLSLGVPTENVKQEKEIKEVKNDFITKENLKVPNVRKKANQLIRAVADSQGSTDGAGTHSK
ncbi:hypothetical protein [Methanobacterium sp. CWC-01]|uniref:hypothetical protein n=1 Tax=Methanobacterium aridiramus TaxID=2584467 RepID=UPI002575D16A|nr:hypothetical protein [Methanobacterium sp. CWC-01]